MKNSLLFACLLAFLFPVVPGCKYNQEPKLPVPEQRPRQQKKVEQVTPEEKTPEPVKQEPVKQEPVKQQEAEQEEAEQAENTEPVDSQTAKEASPEQASQQQASSGQASAKKKAAGNNNQSPSGSTGGTGRSGGTGGTVGTNGSGGTGGAGHTGVPMPDNASSLVQQMSPGEARVECQKLMEKARSLQKKKDYSEAYLSAAQALELLCATQAITASTSFQEEKSQILQLMSACDKQMPNEKPSDSVLLILQ